VAYSPDTALIVVDMQNDFASPKGSLFVPGAPTVVDNVNREVEDAAKSGALTVYTQDWHPAKTPHFAAYGGPWPVHCVAESWGAAFHPDVRVVPGATVVRKGVAGEDGYSGFTVRDVASGEERDTALEGLLREGGVSRVVVVGLATDYCVKETALDSIRRGFETTVLADAVAAVDLQAGDGDRALDAVREAGGSVV
jgi:nicotinamidase/pyrazinamidase